MEQRRYTAWMLEGDYKLVTEKFNTEHVCLKDL